MSFAAPYPIDNNFKHHAPHGNQVERYQVVRDAAKTFAKSVIDTSQPSREQSIALTRIEEAVFWANAGIARNETAPVSLAPAPETAPAQAPTDAAAPAAETVTSPAPVEGQAAS